MPLGFMDKRTITLVHRLAETKGFAPRTGLLVLCRTAMSSGRHTCFFKAFLLLVAVCLAVFYRMDVSLVIKLSSLFVCIWGYMYVGVRGQPWMLFHKITFYLILFCLCLRQGLTLAVTVLELTL